MFQKISCIEKFYASEGYVTIFDFLSNFFLVSQCRKYSQVNPSVLWFKKFPVAKNFMDKRGGSIKIFRRIFFVSQCRKSSQVNPSVLCFKKFPVAKNFMDKRGGSIKIFRRNFFVSQFRKSP